MIDQRTFPSPCPHCGTVHDAIANADGERYAESGDFTLCLNCAAICVFGPGLTLRRLNAGDQKELQANPAFARRLLYAARLIEAHRQTRPDHSKESKP
jgi:hypothetical protein